MNKPPNKAGTMAKVLARATGFWKTVSPLALMVAFAAMSATTLADYTTGTVSGLTAKQRYPWNGKVDISFTLSGPESGYCVAITATNMATGAEIPVRTLRGQTGNVINAETEFTPGTVALVWDAISDAPGLLVETLVLAIDTAPLHGKVQLWEGGPYWAETNIGADEPWEYGLYFWWGDTVGYWRKGDVWVANDGVLSNFSFSEENTPTYYKTQTTLLNEGWIVLKDGIYALAPAHDAACVHWGGSWRIPTKQELDCLNSNCDWTWTTMNNVNGYVVRGRGDYSEKSIFLPAAGYGFGTSLINYADSFGIYWSSVLYADGYSWNLGFESDKHGMNSNKCLLGRSIRPVLRFTE